MVLVEQQQISHALDQTLEIVVALKDFVGATSHIAVKDAKKRTDSVKIQRHLHL